MEFLYTQEISLTINDDKLSIFDADNEFRYYSKTLVSLYALGDKYDIPTLCTYVVELFERDIRVGDVVEKLLHCVPEIYSLVPDHDRTLREMSAWWCYFPIRLR